MRINSLEKLKNFLIETYHVKINFTKAAESDLKEINRGSRSAVLGVIVRRVQEGPLFVPEGFAQFLHGKLHGYAKIKPKALNLRIVYRPVRHDDYISMEIIAIGPRDHDKVYEEATKRLSKK